MRDYQSFEVRNVSVIGHSGAGKTSVLEAMLYYTKATDRFGKTTEGSSMIDFDVEEIRRGLSIYTTIVPIEWEDSKINFIDTPGYLDFVGEKQGGFAVGDSSLIVVNAKDPLQSGTKLAYKQAIAEKKPTIFFINKLDEEHTSFDASYQALREEFGKSVIPFEVPIIEDGKIVGSVNIIKNKAWYYSPELADKACPVPESMQEEVALYKDQIAEAVAMGDDELMEKFFSGEEFSDAELKRGVRIGVRNGEICPVYSGSAVNSIGIQRLMDLIVDYFPTYSERGMYTATTPNGVKVELLTSETEVLTAQVFKTIMDPFVGRISYVKVLSGVLAADSTVVNANNGKPEKISQIYIVKGKHQTAAGKLFTGDIGALVKLQNTRTNDTLCDKGKLLMADPITFDTPMYGQAVVPKTKNDEDRLSNGLARLQEEDPTFKAHTDQETGQTIIAGMGELHLEVIVDRLLREFNVEANVGAPQVAYKETFTTAVDIDSKYAKQSGGRGQYGHCKVKFEPMDPNGEEPFKFESTVVGGAIPKEYIPAVGEGIEEAAQAGILGGFPVLGVHATVWDGSYHEVDSSEMAFHIAGSMAFKDAMKKGNAVLLEPIMKVEVTMPEEYMGDVIGSLNAKRGQIEGMDDIGGGKIVRAFVPLAEMFGYSTELRSTTQGRGNYSMFFEKYQQCPKNVQDKVLAGKNAE